MSHDVGYFARPDGADGVEDNMATPRAAVVCSLLCFGGCATALSVKALSMSVKGVYG